MADLVVRGGRVVTPSGVFQSDLAIEDGRISALGAEISGAAKEIDARGLVVLPAMIDVHLHFNEPGRTEWEGAATGSRALAAGGGAAFFDMPLNSTPCTVGMPEYRAKVEALHASSIADFGIWGGLIPGNREALGELAEAGVVGFKAFLCDSGLPEFPRADDLTLYEGMSEAARAGVPVSVHAENEELVRTLGQRRLDAGKTTIRDFLDCRPVLAEVEAIQRAGLIAAETGAKVHIVHISTGRGVAAALEARARGADISIETCPHYLFFTEDDLERIGAVAKCAPPLRSPEDREDLWRRLLAGEVDIVASDHSPAPPSMKQDANFFKIWGGIAGVQSSLNVLLEEGHLKRGLTLDRIADLTAATPARRFGLSGKGSIEVGNEADLTLIDLDQAFTLSGKDLEQRHKLSPYLSYTFHGRIRQTLLRGQTIFDGTKPIAAGNARQVTPRKDSHERTRTNS